MLAVGMVVGGLVALSAALILPAIFDWIEGGSLEETAEGLERQRRTSIRGFRAKMSLEAEYAQEQQQEQMEMGEVFLQRNRLMNSGFYDKHLVRNSEPERDMVSLLSDDLGMSPAELAARLNPRRMGVRGATRTNRTLALKAMEGPKGQGQGGVA